MHVLAKTTKSWRKKSDDLCCGLSASSEMLPKRVGTKSDDLCLAPRREVGRGLVCGEWAGGSSVRFCHASGPSLPPAARGRNCVVFGLGVLVCSGFGVVVGRGHVFRGWGGSYSCCNQPHRDQYGHAEGLESLSFPPPMEVPF